MWFLPLCARAAFTPGIASFSNGGERDSPYPGFTGSKQVSQEIQIQDAHARIPAASCEKGRLVHINRSDGRVFPHTDLSSAQKGAYMRSHATPARVRFRDKCGKEHAVTSSEYNLTGIISEFCDLHGAPLGGACDNFHSVSRAFSTKQICSFRIMSSVTRTDGFCRPHSPPGPPPHEGISTVGGLLQTGSHASWRTESVGHCGRQLDGHQPPRGGCIPVVCTCWHAN